jgi:hypothetical protein
MNRLEGSKTAAKVSDITASQTHEHTIDTLGFSYASIDVAFEPVAAGGTASAVASVLTLQHSDAVGSGFSAVTGFVSGTNYTIPTPSNTTDSAVVRLNVDLEGKKRYLRVSATPTTAGAVSSVARLGVAEAVPLAASAAGVGAFVSG